MEKEINAAFDGFCKAMEELRLKHTAHIALRK